MMPGMRPLLALLALAGTLLGLPSRTHAQLPAAGNLARTNLVAWCIVPFDSRKRGPEERAAMLERLGIRRLAYDWRAEHIPTFDAEVEAMRRHRIEITAWWFPAGLNDEARAILACIERQKIHPQLWITLGTEPEPNPDTLTRKIAAAVESLKPVCTEARRLGCPVALYNHLGWFGEPSNQVRVVRALHDAGFPNVGSVYNFHHAHAHIDDFARHFHTLQPHLLALNLNGMVPDGDRTGRKIIPLGTGTEELELLRIVHASGWKGPVGIIGHTDEDAEAKLRKELDGLERLAPKASTPPSPDRPRRTPPQPRASLLPDPATPSVPGRFGQALDARVHRPVTDGDARFRKPPFTVEAWVRLASSHGYNIIAASEAKASPTHWELYTSAGSGSLALYSPGSTPDNVSGGPNLADGSWHHVAAHVAPGETALFVDGREVARQKVQRRAQPDGSPARFALGRLVEDGIGCDGFIDEVRISRGLRPIPAAPTSPVHADESGIAHWNLDRIDTAVAALNSPAIAGSKPVNPESGARPAGTPSTSGREPGLQGEGDWVDNRWQASDIGRHLAATFRLHDNTTVTRGLAIRLGKADQGAVLYDTATASLRAAWTGAFLQFDPARFGLIGAPRTAGTPAFRIGTHTQWPKARVEFAAVRVGRDAVGLEWRVDGSTVTEVPSVQETPVGTVFLRHFTVAAHDRDLEFVLGAHLRGDTHAGSGEDRAPEPPRHLATASGPDLATAALLVGVGSSYSGVHVGKDSTIETLRLPASRREQHFTVALWAGPKSGLETFQNWAQSLRVTRPASLLAPPAPEPEIATAGQLDSGNDLFAVDTLTFPYDNPARSLFFASGVDVAPDGTVYASAMHGDVWQLRGVDRSLRKLRWRRFATGLYQPLGLKVWKGDVYVLGRDRITRLVDRDRNGIAERQETWFGGVDTSAGGHDYVTCLEVDDQGRFYYVDPKGMHRVQHKDGLTLKETLATGFRNPNGMGVSPDGRVLTAAPQQGTWTPSSGIWEVRPGLYGGYGGPKVTPERPDGYDHPLCWIPHAVDNSSGSQVWIPRGEWGVLGGRMLHLLWGRCGLMLVLRDTDASSTGINGAVVPLPAKFLSGPNRASWNRRDDSLLVAGSTGWQTSAVKDGSLHRVRWKGGNPSVPIDWKVVRGGIEVEFAEPLDPATANDAGSWSIRAWNYRYAEAYGSKDWKPSEPQKEGRDAWDVSAAELLPGGRRVRLTVPSIAPVMQGELKYNVNAAKAARPLKGSLWFTVNRVP